MNAAAESAAEETHTADGTTVARIAVVIVAAGLGIRLGAGVPKAYVDVGGRSLLLRCLDAVSALPEPIQVVIVAPADRVAETLETAAPVVATAQPGSRLTVITGGVTRQDSVAAGLRALAPEIETVLVHDAARAFTPTSLFESVIQAVSRLGHGVVPALPMSDTVKRVDAEGRVLETVDRSQLAAVQTPQGFPRGELVEAYRRATQEFTDDAALVAADGLPVTIIDGDPSAFKVTTPWDRARAEDIASQAAERSDTPSGVHSPVADAGAQRVPAPDAPRGGHERSRIGVGTDTHAFADGRPLWLAGLEWPGESGLAGHSDGDAVCHAITDALLSAAHLGDIGSMFGTDDPRYAGAPGETFLAGARELVEREGFRIGNVAVQLIGNRPRFGSRRAEAEDKLSSVLGAPVSVSATTTDGLGFTGRGEGVTAIATAILVGVTG
jgi:2-C-methyl-D-erythritol 4-phosphate cytidylyltransferase/2-C-methyl-D-erythritol 2,4-cyclodiphosphate synthase